MAPQTSPPQEARYCLCGCETPTSAKKTWQKDELHGKRAIYRQGHDARHASQIAARLIHGEPDAPPGTLQVVSWIVPRDHDLCWAHRHETSQSMYVELWRSKPLRRALTEWLADDARQAETAKGVG